MVKADTLANEAPKTMVHNLKASTVTLVHMSPSHMHRHTHIHLRIARHTHLTQIQCRLTPLTIHVCTLRPFMRQFMCICLIFRMFIWMPCTHCPCTHQHTHVCACRVLHASCSHTICMLARCSRASASTSSPPRLDCLCASGCAAYSCKWV